MQTQRLHLPPGKQAIPAERELRIESMAGSISGVGLRTIGKEMKGHEKSGTGHVLKPNP
jgi:hypothetical protein